GHRVSAQVVLEAGVDGGGGEHLVVQRGAPISVEPILPNAALLIPTRDRRGEVLSTERRTVGERGLDLPTEAVVLKIREDRGLARVVGARDLGDVAAIEIPRAVDDDGVGARSTALDLIRAAETVEVRTRPLVAGAARGRNRDLFVLGSRRTQVDVRSLLVI